MAPKIGKTDDAIVASVKKHGGVRAAAAALGMPYSSFQRDYTRAKAAKAAPASVPATPALPPEMLSLLQAMAAAFSSPQADLKAAKSKPVSPDLVQGVKARRKARDERAEDNRPFAGGDDEPPESRIGIAAGRRFVVAAAQNNTWVDDGFLQTLIRFCDLHGAELKVGCLAYNKKGWAQPHRVAKEDTSLWYDPAIAPYISNDPLRLAPELVWCGDLDVSPTAVDPLSGFDSYTAASSGIVPHSKVHAKSMPVLKGRKPRFMYTSGICTKPNYIQRKAGQKAVFHHTVGALYVEVDEDGTHFVRQLIANRDGSFNDLGMKYTRDGAESERLAGIVWPDVHIEKCGQSTVDACFVGPHSIRGTLRPEKQVHHDVIHFGTRSHHAIRDPHHTAADAWAGTDSVEAEFQISADYLAARDAEDDSEKFVIPSNHQDHPVKWLKDPAGAADGKNARYWHWLNYNLHTALSRGRHDFDVFEFGVRERADLARTRFLRRDESLEIAGIECGMHGDIGANGSRGSLKQYSKLGVKTVTGHKHSGEAWDGAWSVGALELEQGYNVGPSSWSVSLILIYQSGKRSLVTMHGTRWRGATIKKRVRVQAKGVAVGEFPVGRAA